MTKIAEMNDAAFNDMLSGALNDYFAPAEKRQQLTQYEVKAIASYLNEQIDVPLITETGEQRILIKIIMKVDGFLYDHLPNEMYDLMRSTQGGIDDIEAKRLAKRLTKLANTKIDIPYIPEVAEYFVIRFVIGVVVNAARKHLDMEGAIEAMKNRVISFVAQPSDEELEGLVG